MSLKLSTQFKTTWIPRAAQLSAALLSASLLSSCALQSSSDQNFRTYLANQSNKLTPPEQTAINQFLTDNTLNEQQQNTIQNQLGLYTVERYGDEAIETLIEFVAIPTYRQTGVEQHENPEFKKLAAAIAAKAEEFGLEFRNIDDRVYEVTLPGATEELVGLHAHADVVQVNPDNWVLENGTKLDPFEVTQIDGRMYGRGTEDDKNGIVATLYGMRVIKDEHLPLQRTFKLLIDTTEETTGDAIPYYFARNPTPQYNLAMDGSYPVVIAEKGYGLVLTEFPVTEGSGNGIEFTSLTGGLATNQIPKSASATIKAGDLIMTQKSLRLAADQFISQNGGNFTIEIIREDDQLKLTVTGVSAHSSDPASGINPVSRLLIFIDELNSRINVQQNHITNAAKYAAQNWGLNFYAKKMGVDFSHPFMGPLTNAITLIDLNQERLKLAVNLRVPEGKPTATLQQEIENNLMSWSNTQGIDFDLEIKIAEPMFRNPKGAWVNALLDVASTNLDIPREFAASAGATSVHNLPNGVQFGLSMPGVKYTGHNANEFKTVEQFLLDLKIVTEMIVKVGQLPELD